MKKRRLIRQYSGIRLDLGCGEAKQPGWIGIDARPLKGVDIVHNLETFPWPLDDECVNVALCSHLVEHIEPHGGVFLRFMDELWRVMKPGAEVAIATPHAMSQGYAQDPTHCNPINEATWAYFDPRHPSGLWNIYKPKPWFIKFLSWSPNANIEVVLVKPEVGNE